MDELKLIPLDLSVLSEDVIEILLSDGSTEPSLFDEIAQKNIRRPNVLNHILNHPLTPDTTRRFVAQILHLPVPVTTAIRTMYETEEEIIIQNKPESLLQRIQKLKVTEKIQLAIRGSRVIRTFLLRDPNKEVMLAVLENPKIAESEVELVAKQKTTPVEILRAIAKKREWLRTYSIVHALITNPKTPLVIALKHIHTLRLKDLSLLEKNRNVSGAIRAAAKNLVTARKLS